MAPVIDLEKPRLAGATKARLSDSSMAVVTVTEAGSADVSIYVYPGPVTTELPYLRGEDYPALVRIWDNDDDATFDTM